MIAIGITAVVALAALCAFRLIVTAPTRGVLRRRDLVRPLSIPARDGFARDWWRIQAEFVDTPWVAFTEADALVARVLDARGTPAPQHLESVRKAARGASTEELRQGLIHYRRLFAELLEHPVEDRPNPN